MKKKKSGVRITAGLTLMAMLAASTLAPMTAIAAPASVAVEETMYLNLDYYGSIAKANVVKGVSFNSLKSYTDYGEYTDVLNMSTSEKPVIQGDSVTFSAPENGGKFFFQGTLDPEKVVAPWTFDVTYKVNGIITNAEDVAGASGLVEIDIDAYPNDKASEYMKNNFMLIVAIPTDNNKIKSLDAPGSQMASLGQYEGAVFLGLPGKEQHYEVRIGTDSFETVGAVIMMTPGTVAGLENLRDVKDLVDKFRDNTNAMLDDVSALMDNVTDMSKQLELNTQMLSELRSGKNKISTAKDSIFRGNDVLIEDLETLAGELEPLSGSLKTIQWMVYDLNTDMNAMDQHVMDASAKMNTLSSRLKALGNSLGGVDNLTAQELSAELAVVQQSLEKVQVGLEAGKNAAFTFGGDMAKLTDSGTRMVASASDLVPTRNVIRDAAKEEGISQEAAEAVISLMNQSGSSALTEETVTGLKQLLVYQYQQDAAAAESFVDRIVAVQSLQSQAAEVTEAAAKVGVDVSFGALGVGLALGSIADDLTEIYEDDGVAEQLADAIAALSADIEDISDDTAAVSFQTARFLNSLRNLMGDLDTVIGTMNEYYGDVQGLLSNTDSLLGTLEKSSKDLAGTLKITNDTLRDASENLGRAADLGLEAGELAVDNAGKMIENTKNLKQSGADLRKSINDELDEQEAEHNFFKMDPDATKLSFTSEKNIEPTALSIVARTEEISIEDTTVENLDSEIPEESVSPLRRIANVFVTIFEGAKKLFGGKK